MLKLMKVNEEFRMMCTVKLGITMNRLYFVLQITVLMMLSGPLAAQQLPAAESWERDEAWRASTSVSTQSERNRLSQLLKAGNTTATLNLIRQIVQRSDWPGPARERVIFEFTSSLRQETPRAADDELIAYLMDFQSTVFIPHEDHPASGVPMFNIKGAAAGVVNGWSRQEAAFQGATLISYDPVSLAPAYLAENSRPRQQGLLDALDTASPAQLQALSGFALAGLDSEPELIAIAAKAALMNADIDALLVLAEKGRGVQMQGLFKESADLFGLQKNQLMLQAALRNPSSETAALAIAQLAPTLAGHKPTQDLLLKLLGDPQLGSSSALALAMNPGTRVLGELQRLADSEQNVLSASRARLALQIHASQFSTQTLR